jgi:hypothetical protein
MPANNIEKLIIFRVGLKENNTKYFLFDFIERHLLIWSQFFFFLLLLKTQFF